MSKRTLLPFIGLWLVLLLLAPTRSSAQSTPDSRFGMTEAFWLPDEAQELDVGWERILFYWREIQPAGPDDWNTLHVREEWLVEAERQGREVVGLIKNTAPWASVDGTEAGLPQGLYLPADDPGNLWANFVRRLAEYYGQRGVHHWIVWNEPEIQKGVYGFEFAGTAADYYQMLKTAYKVIKEHDSQAVIHLAGLTWWHDPTFLDRLLALAARDPESSDEDYYFDIISLHIYFRTETVRSIIEEVNEIQDRYGLSKPIWINETNAPPNRDPEWPVNRPRFNIDLDQQARFIIQAVALGFVSGAERISVYKLIDIHLPPGGESFGVVRPDLSKRPAYYAYKMATRCFGAFDEVFMEEDPLYYRITFARPGTLTHIAWARTPAASTMQIPASSSSATVLGLSRPASEILPSDGSYTLQLSGQRCDEECLVGGEPILLLETTGEDHYTQSCLDFLSAGEASTAKEGNPGDPDPEEAETMIAESGLGEATGKATATSALADATSERPTLQAAEASSGGQNVSKAAAINDLGGTAAATEPTRSAVQDKMAVEATPDDGQFDLESSSGLVEMIGLWILGLALVLALIILFLYLRARAGHQP